jgi:hypothetical protein
VSSVLPQALLLRSAQAIRPGVAMTTMLSDADAPMCVVAPPSESGLNAWTA